MKRLVTILLILLVGLAHAQINDNWESIKVGEEDFLKMYIGEDLVWETPSNSAPYVVNTSSTYYTTSGTSRTVDYPSDVQAGDYLLLISVYEEGVTQSQTPISNNGSGFSLLSRGEEALLGDAPNIVLFGRIATAQDESASTATIEYESSTAALAGMMNVRDYSEIGNLNQFLDISSTTEISDVMIADESGSLFIYASGMANTGQSAPAYVSGWTRGAGFSGSTTLNGAWFYAAKATTSPSISWSTASTYHRAMMIEFLQE